MPRNGYTPILQPGLLEPCAVKVARTVLRGAGTGNSLRLPDNILASRIGYCILFFAITIAEADLVGSLAEYNSLSIRVRVAPRPRSSVNR